LLYDSDPVRVNPKKNTSSSTLAPNQKQSCILHKANEMSFCFDSKSNSIDNSGDKLYARKSQFYCTQFYELNTNKERL